MTKAEKARILRPIIELAVQSINDDETAIAATDLFEKWQPDTEYITDMKVRYWDVLYKVLQNHTSQANWTPDVTPSLYARVLIPDPTVIPDWVQPDSTNPYMTGDKVRHNGHVWVSTIDNNVWEPGVYGWEIDE